jgi:hypothetical protein
MTDVTIREIRNLRELADPPAPRPEPDPDKEKAARDARFAEIQALIPLCQDQVRHQEQQLLVELEG